MQGLWWSGLMVLIYLVAGDFIIMGGIYDRLVC